MATIVDTDSSLIPFLILGVVITVCLLPETKGFSLEELGAVRQMSRKAA